LGVDLTHASQQLLVLQTCLAIRLTHFVPCVVEHIVLEQFCVWHTTILDGIDPYFYSICA
jgi:hypothetical protein